MNIRRLPAIGTSGTANQAPTSVACATDCPPTHTHTWVKCLIRLPNLASALWYFQQTLAKWHILDLNRMLQAIAGLKVSIQLQSPHFDVGDRPTWSLPGGAGRGVCSDQLHSEQDIWSEHCQNPRQSSRQPKTTRATAHQSDTGPQYLWRHQRNFGVRGGSSLEKKTGKKASRWGFLSFRVGPAGWPDGLQSILNKQDSAFIDLNKLNLNKCLEKAWEYL